MKSEMEMGKRDYGFKEDQREKEKEKKKREQTKGLACSLRPLFVCAGYLPKSTDKPAYSKRGFRQHRCSPGLQVLI